MAGDVRARPWGIVQGRHDELTVIAGLDDVATSWLGGPPIMQWAIVK